MMSRINVDAFGVRAAIRHPYRREHGNFYSRGVATGYESWAEFAQPVTYDRTGPQLIQHGTLLHDGDPDMNLLFRWDWRAMHLEFPEGYPDGAEQHYLDLFFMMQGKPYNQSVRIKVTPADEPAVRAWLAGRAETMRAMWQPSWARNLIRRRRPRRQ